jgi:simple sugar transport system permease protein
MLAALFRKYRLQFAISGVFVIILLVFIAANPRVFLDYGTYRSLMVILPVNIILAVSLVYVIICSEIDLSFGSIMGLSVWLFTAIYSKGLGAGVGLVAALVLGVLAGAFNGIIVTKLRISSLVITLGMSFFWRGIVMIITQGMGVPLGVYNSSLMYFIFAGRVGDFPIQMLWALLFTFGSWLILNRHKFGAYIYYSGDNYESANMMGIKVDRIKIFAFAFVGLSSAVAGIISTSVNMTYWPTLGDGTLLPVLASVFIGGTPVGGGVGTVYGTFVGAMIIGCIETGIIATGLTGFFTQMFYGLIIVLSVVVHRLIRR